MLIYTSASADKITTINLDSGQENLLLESRVIGAGGISTINLSATNDLYFLSNHSLLKFDQNHHLLMSTIEINAENFTLSPIGSKICFAENGMLFTQKISF